MDRALPQITARTATRRRPNLHQLLVYSLLTLGAAIVLLPYFWMLLASVKHENEIFRVGWDLLPTRLRLENYRDAWQQWPMGRWVLNTFLVAIIQTISTVLTSLLAGFAFARLRWWGRDVLFYVYVAAMMVPIQVTLIPSFLIVRNLGLMNSYAGIVVLHLVQFSGIFLMRQFLLNIPTELEDAARIDGCSWFRVLWQIILPVSLPAMAALSILAFTAGWNDFLWPLVINNKPEFMTLIVGLATVRSEATPWGQLMAATAISALPLTIVYLILQRWFAQGIVMSGIKG